MKPPERLLRLKRLVDATIAMYEADMIRENDPDDPRSWMPKDEFRLGDFHITDHQLQKDR